jgi:hypothetical protein
MMVSTCHTFSAACDACDESEYMPLPLMHLVLPEKFASDDSTVYGDF